MSAKSHPCLPITTYLSILLTSLHLSDDIARGIEPGDLTTLIGISILVVWLFAAMRLKGRRSGYIILLLGAALGIAIPILHLRGEGVGGGIATSSGGLFFTWTLIALGTSAAASFILAAEGLWHLHRDRSG